jgi:predicted DNA-binding ribbon-helix-helix protein
MPPPPPLSGRPVKRSLTLAGHRTSVSLEDAFWTAFRAIAARDGLPLNALAARIDATRQDTGLATAIRLFVLADALARAAPERHRPDNAGPVRSP